jgi:protein SCO1
MYRIAFLLVINLLLISCAEKKASISVLPYYNEPDFTPQFVDNSSEVYDKITHTIRDFSLINQDNEPVSQELFNHKIHVANFIFTSCGSICPTMTQNLKIVSDSLKNDPRVAFLSFSVTPWIDTPDVLRRFRNKYSISNPNWQFLTGNKTEIYNLARQSYFAEEDIGFSKDSTEFLHTEHFILVDQTKRIRGIYNGTLRLEMMNLLADIKTLKESE